MTGYDLRKHVVLKETIRSEGGFPAATPVIRVAGLGVIANPFAGRSVDDLSRLFDIGLELGEALMADMVPLLAGPAVSYGKAAIVGAGGDLEHGHALLHPKLGKAMREPIGGGRSPDPLRGQDRRRGRRHRHSPRTQGRRLVVRPLRYPDGLACRRAAPGRDRPRNRCRRWGTSGPSRRQGARRRVDAK